MYILENVKSQSSWLTIFLFLLPNNNIWGADIRPGEEMGAVHSPWGLIDNLEQKHMLLLMDGWINWNLCSHDDELSDSGSSGMLFFFLKNAYCRSSLIPFLYDLSFLLKKKVKLV